MSAVTESFAALQKVFHKLLNNHVGVIAHAFASDLKHGMESVNVLFSVMYCV